jgi:hypothetical protein
MISFASVFLSLYEMYSLVHKFIYRVYIYFCFVKGFFYPSIIFLSRGVLRVMTTSDLKIYKNN